MSWYEKLGLKFVLGRISDKLGEKGMQTIGALAVILMGGAAFLNGLSCVLQHFVNGDLMSGDHLQTCLLSFGTAAAIASPGFEKLKVGWFARTLQQTASGTVVEKPQTEITIKESLATPVQAPVAPLVSPDAGSK